MSELNLEEVRSKIRGETDLTDEDIDKKIEERKEKYGGLLNDKGALFSIAKDNGIDVESGHEPEPTEVADLDPQIQNVTIKGTIKKIYPVKEWKKEDREGRVGNIEVKDNTGEVKIVLWNDKCDMIEENELEVGDKIKIANGRLKERNEKIEISSGDITTIEEEDLPEVTQEVKKIKDLEPGMQEVNLFAKVGAAFPVKEFERNGKPGKVANAIIYDGEKARLVLWNQNASWTKKLEQGDTIKIEGAYTKENNGRTELHLGWRGRVVPEPSNAPELPDPPKKTNKRKNIKELEEGDTYTDVFAVIVDTYSPNLVKLCPKCRKKAEDECPECGEKTVPVLIQNLVLDDGTEVIRAVAFREKAEELVGFSPDEYAENPEVFDKKALLGKEMIFSGQVKLNPVNKEKEFIIHNAKETNPEKELKKWQTK